MKKGITNKQDLNASKTNFYFGGRLTLIPESQIEEDFIDTLYVDSPDSFNSKEIQSLKVDRRVLNVDVT